MNSVHKRFGAGLAVVLLVLLTALLAGCGSNDDSASESTTDAAYDQGSDADSSAEDSADGSDENASVAVDADSEESAQVETTVIAPEVTTADEAPPEGDGDENGDEVDGEEPAETEGDLGSGAAPANTPTAAELGRKIIFNATITVQVDDVAASSRQATDIISDLGGFVYGQQTTTGSQATTTLIFKVLPDDFSAAVESLGTVGELRDQAITANDVTQRIVDLQTRIEVAELGVERLRTTLTQTTDLEDYSELEKLLLERETDLEVMRAQLRNLSEQVNLATITLTLTQEQINHAVNVTASAYEARDGGQSCPGDRTDGALIEEGAELTLCWQIVNVGDEPLVDLTIIDAGLGINSVDDLIVVFGDPARLEAGQTLIVAKEVEMERTVNLRTKVTARPADAEGEVSGPSIDALVDARFPAAPSTDEPGFGDGFSAGVDVVKGLWAIATVLVGFIIPMLVLTPLVALAWYGLRRWRASRRNRAPKQPPLPPSPPTGQPVMVAVANPPGGPGGAPGATSGD